MRSLLSALCVSLVVAGAAPAYAAPADAIGSAVTVVNVVTAQLAQETRTLATGDDVRQNEIVEVGLNASSELRLKDDTKLALGPGSRLVLDRFVYNPEQSGGAIFLNLAKGTFRFITGLAQKPAYVIRVPGASITVRGTIFHVRVEDSGRSSLLLEEGAVRICNDRGSCRDHNEIGKIIPISEGGDVGKPTRWTSLPGVQKVAFDDAFPFVGNPDEGKNSGFTRARIIDDKPVKIEQPKEANNTDSGPAPRRQVKVPQIDKVASKVVRVNEPAKVEYPQRVSTGRGKLMDKVAAHAPGLVNRIEERRSYRSSDDTTGNSLATGGMFGNGYKKSYVPH